MKTVTYLALFLIAAFGFAEGRGEQPLAKKNSKGPKSASFKRMSWTDAFDKLHARLSEEYPFTDWRGIDWPALYSVAAPKIAAAETAGDTQAYYLALREYVTSVPDGHMYISGDSTARHAAVGGGFGLVAIPLDDGRVIAHHVWPNGPAAAAGMTTGAELTSWNGQSPTVAASRVSVLWAETIPGVAANLALEQYRLLVRGPVGSSVIVGFMNSGSTQTTTAPLTAVNDAYLSLKFTSFSAKKGSTKAQVLPSGFGYVQVTNTSNRSRKKLGKALKKLSRAAVPGVILDLRGNEGGSDEAAARMAAFFYDRPAFYDHIIVYDRKVKGEVWETGESVDMKPRKIHFDGPVVVLVNPHTISSGEGVAWGIQALPDGYVMGFAGTNGAFGITSVGIVMPKGYHVEYPFGRSVDESFEVQIDSDMNGVGGVVPDLLIPRTESRMLAVGAGEDVLLAEAEAFLAGL